MIDDQHRDLDELPEGIARILARIRAEPVPPQLAARARSQLSTQLTADHRQAAHWLAFAAAAALMISAATALVIFYPYSSIDGVTPTLESNIASRDNRQADDSETHGPSLWTYHLALNDSPERIDRLLDQHAVAILTPAPRRGVYRIHSALPIPEEP